MEEILVKDEKKALLIDICHSNRQKKGDCHKLYSACISTTSGPIFTNKVALESLKWGLSTHMREVQERQQMTEISGHQ